MNDLDVLKRVPREHYTTHLGKLLKVEELIQILQNENDKYVDGDVSRQTAKRRVQKVSNIRKK